VLGGGGRRGAWTKGSGRNIHGKVAISMVKGWRFYLRSRRYLVHEGDKKEHL